MSQYIDTYCSLDFLLQFYSEYQRSWIEASEDTRKAEILKNIKLLIELRSDLYLDKVLEADNPYIQKLINTRATYRSGRLFDYSDEFAMLNDATFIESNLSISSIHLHKGSNHYSQQYLLLAKPESWFDDLKDVSVDPTEYKISSNPQSHNFPGWRTFAENHKLNRYLINSLIISDVRICDNLDTLDLNLFEILKNLLPIHINCDFHLTLILSSDQVRKAQDILERINKFLTSLGRQYKILISLYFLLPRNNHSREIISNYWRIKNDHNFDMYKSNGEIRYKSSLEFIPLNSKNGNNHNSILNELGRTLKHSEFNLDWFGSDIPNRLLKG